MKGLDSRTIIGNTKNCLTTGGTVGQLCIISRSNFRQFVEAVHATNGCNASYWNDRSNNDNNNNNGVNINNNDDNDNNNGADGQGSPGSKGKGKGKGKSKVTKKTVGIRPTIAFTGQDKEDFLNQVQDVDR